MSGHETIRVLEVGVDAQLPAEEESKGLESVAADGSQSRGPAEAGEPAAEAGPRDPDHSAEATGRRLSLICCFSLLAQVAQVALGPCLPARLAPLATVHNAGQFPGIPYPPYI